MVGDVGIKYRIKKNAIHLLSLLRKTYNITTDWRGERYIGITLSWNYFKRIVDLSMLEYIEIVLNGVCIPSYNRKQYSLHGWLKAQYGASTQLTQNLDFFHPSIPRKASARRILLE